MISCIQVLLKTSRLIIERNHNVCESIREIVKINLSNNFSFQKLYTELFEIGTLLQ